MKFLSTLVLLITLFITIDCTNIRNKILSLKTSEREIRKEVEDIIENEKLDNIAKINRRRDMFKSRLDIAKGKISSELGIILSKLEKEDLVKKEKAKEAKISAVIDEKKEEVEADLNKQRGVITKKITEKLEKALPDATPVEISKIAEERTDEVINRVVDDSVDIDKTVEKAKEDLKKDTDFFDLFKPTKKPDPESLKEAENVVDNLLDDLEQASESVDKHQPVSEEVQDAIVDVVSEVAK